MIVVFHFSDGTDQVCEDVKEFDPYVLAADGKFFEVLYNDGSIALIPERLVEGIEITP